MVEWLSDNRSLALWLLSLAVAFGYHYSPELYSYLQHESHVYPPPTRVVPARAVSYYDAYRDMTYVNLTQNMVLTSDADRRLTFTASFSVPGARIAQPRVVVLSFWSSSEEPLYHFNHDLKIYTDNRLIFYGRTREPITTPQSIYGVTEYLSVEIPYGTFDQMRRSRSAYIVLGDNEAELNATVIAALGELQRYTDEGRD